MTVKQAALRLEVSPATIYGLVASGRLKCYRIGAGRGVIRIAEEHVSEYLRTAETEPARPPAPRARLKHLRL